MTAAELHLDPDADPKRGLTPLVGVSYTAILNQVFGVASEFDVETEHAVPEARGPLRPPAART